MFIKVSPPRLHQGDYDNLTSWDICRIQEFHRPDFTKGIAITSTNPFNSSVFAPTTLLAYLAVRVGDTIRYRKISKDLKMKLERILEQVLNVALLFTLVMTQSWISDGLAGNELFSWWSGGFQCKTTCDASFWKLEVFLLLASVTCAVLLYQRRHTFLSVSVRRISPLGLVDPHQVLILVVSDASWTWTNRGLLSKDKKLVELSPKLSEALTQMENLGEKFAWEQILRAIMAHQTRLQRIVLIGSSNGKKTVERLDECARMIEHYCGLSVAKTDRFGVNFESIDELLKRYRQLIEGEKIRRRHLMIDITGGTKVVSVAAAMVTLEYPEIEFQYVETEGTGKNKEKLVRSFNVISVLPEL